MALSSLFGRGLRRVLARLGSAARGSVAAGTLGVLTLAAGCAGPAPLTPEQKDLNLRSFDEVWVTARDRNFDPTLGGVDWNAVKTELRPKVEQARTMDQARAVMNQMLERLKQSHFGIIPAEFYGAVAGEEKAKDEGGQGNGETGIHLRLVDGQALIVRVDPGSSGDRAGVKPGWLLLRAGKASSADVIAKLRKAHGESIQTLTYACFAFERMLRGEVGSTIELTLTGDSDATLTKTVEFEAPTGTATTLGNLPTFYVDFRSEELAVAGGSIGYLWFSAFLDPQHLMPRVTEAVSGFAGCRGIVIDMRGNPGGLGAMAMGVAGHFVPEQKKLGEMVTRDGTMKFLVFPRARTFPGKLAILTDESSVSTAEILAGGMKDLGRARIFGTRTAGQALPSTVTRLPNGDGFQYAFANYISAGGKALEGDGVTPDVVVPPTRSALLAGRDPALEAAKAWILSDASENKVQ